MIAGRWRLLTRRWKALRLDPEFRRARLWTNEELSRIGPHFRGNVINVSGWADEDKFGGVYRDYFTNAVSYSVSNLGGGPQRGMDRMLADSLDIDLDKPLEPRFRQAFDCVFSHTVLEHVFNVFQAAENLAEMSRDAIVFIVPFVQRIHTEEGHYSDFWRFTPHCIERLFERHGYQPVYRSGTSIPGSSLYYLYVLSRHPERYRAAFGEPTSRDRLPGGRDIYSMDRLKNYLKYLWFRQSEFSC